MAVFKKIYPKTEDQERNSNCFAENPFYGLDTMYCGFG
jgi:hypothetical protein